jgi:L-fuconolactonase
MNPLLNTIPIIDSHIHLWDINRLSYPWLDNVPAIRKSFYIEDYQQATSDFQIEKMVFIQGECKPEDNLREIDFAMQQVSKDRRIQAIVAYAPLEKGKDVLQLLNSFSSNPLIKGVRRMYDDNPDICYSFSFLDGANLLADQGLSFDISIKPVSMKPTIHMIKECPGTQFIIDHLGKPDIRNRSLDEFRLAMEKLAFFPNVTAKVSGLITEADKDDWNIEHLLPYIKHAIQCFGFDRLLFGSDWPVVLLAGSFEKWVNALQEILNDCSPEELNKLFHDNAVRIYKL